MYAMLLSKLTAAINFNKFKNKINLQILNVIRAGRAEQQLFCY